MQHTLIPLQDRKRLHREYSLRVLVVSVFTLSAALLIGSAAIFPAYLYASFNRASMEAQIESVKRENSDEGLDAATKELFSARKLLASFGGVAGKTDYSEMIESMLSVRQPVALSLIYLEQSDKGVEIRLSGVAPNRAELIAFRSRLEKLFAGTKIEIPIEQLARNSNPSFNFSFMPKMP